MPQTPTGHSSGSSGRSSGSSAGRSMSSLRAVRSGKCVNGEGLKGSVVATSVATADEWMNAALAAPWAAAALDLVYWREGRGATCSVAADTAAAVAAGTVTGAVTARATAMAWAAAMDVGEAAAGSPVARHKSGMRHSRRCRDRSGVARTSPCTTCHNVLASRNSLDKAAAAAMAAAAAADAVVAVGWEMAGVATVGARSLGKRGRAPARKR